MGRGGVVTFVSCAILVLRPKQLISNKLRDLSMY
jgi:hypothetical protein